jgi:hypothetical protein
MKRGFMFEGTGVVSGEQELLQKFAISFGEYVVDAYQRIIGCTNACFCPLNC